MHAKEALEYNGISCPDISFFHCKSRTTSTGSGSDTCTGKVIVSQKTL
jgi:hypothetical protein